MYGYWIQTEHSNSKKRFPSKKRAHSLRKSMLYKDNHIRDFNTMSAIRKIQRRGQSTNDSCVCRGPCNYRVVDRTVTQELLGRNRRSVHQQPTRKPSMCSAIGDACPRQLEALTTGPGRPNKLNPRGCLGLFPPAHGRAPAKIWVRLITSQSFVSE